MSDAYLVSLLELGRAPLGTQVLLDDVLPDNTDVLVAAAGRLYPGRDPTEVREEHRPFYEKALRCLHTQPSRRKAKDCYLEAHLARALGHLNEAVENYRLAVFQAPQKGGWRLEYALALHQNGRLHDARRD